jgi:prolyl 4-hydroxylase
MEEPQIVRYRTGEEFSWHYDEIPSAQLSNGGQRLATLLVYLNDLEEDRGGGTVFRDLTALNDSINEKGSGSGKDRSKGKTRKSNANQLTVRPTTGTALLFFPSYKDGTPDSRTLHKGEVALDNKMIAQLWVHEREYQAGVPEGNVQLDARDGVEQVAKRLGFVQ